MDPFLAGRLECDVALATFAPEQPREGLRYSGLGCRCGGRRFHLAGWPRLATGRGGFFWRSVARVFREARQPMLAGEPAESPFWLPVFARCDACGTESVLLDLAGSPATMDPDRRGEPQESYRCRACRRGTVELLLGEATDRELTGRSDVELRVRCASCHRQARVAWSHDRPTEREMHLDRLYGRR